MGDHKDVVTDSSYKSRIKTIYACVSINQRYEIGSDVSICSRNTVLFVKKYKVPVLYEIRNSKLLRFVCFNYLQSFLNK